jgi:polyhydroxyalkanoate synthesis regulator phasin
MLKILNFLNEFDQIARSKIAALQEKLTNLERQVEFCEASIRSSQDRLKREGK